MLAWQRPSFDCALHGGLMTVAAIGEQGTELNKIISAELSSEDNTAGIMATRAIVVHLCWSIEVWEQGVVDTILVRLWANTPSFVHMYSLRGPLYAGEAFSCVALSYS